MFDNTNWPQIKVTGKLKENAVGAEIITFYVRLACFQLCAIVNVPAEGQNEAPVYVKFMVQEPKDKNDRDV